MRSPGTAPVSGEILSAVVRATPRHVWGSGTFQKYLWLAVWYCVFSTPIPAFVAYYLKVGPQFSSGLIMVFEIVRYMGVFLTAWMLRGRIDRMGAKPFLLLSLALYVIIGGYWWIFLRTHGGGLTIMMLAYGLLGVGATCWTVANLGYLPKIVSEHERPLMVSIHGAVTSCIGGCAPLIWGWFLKDTNAAGPTINVAVFGWFFVTVAASALVLLVLVARLPEDKSVHVEPLSVGSAIMRPLRAMTYLASLVEQPSNRSWVKTEKAPAPPDDDQRPDTKS